MKLPYNAHAIDRARVDARARGHHISGRFLRVWSGLSWQAQCANCRAYVLVTPPLFRAIGTWEYTGPAITDTCPAHAASTIARA